MSIRYIGSKARVVDSILEVLGPPDGGTFFDLFAGTGTVASAAAKAGWPVHINDHLYSSVVMSLSRVASTLAAPFESFGGIGSATEYLNGAEPVHGFMWREYSPASELRVGTKRMYFTEQNAAKIDGIRCEISRLVAEQRVSKLEEKLLLATLMRSANAIANTAGTYGCFLSKWQRQSKVDLRLEPLSLLETHSEAAYTIGDASDVSTSAVDTVYLDPPYTKRQYAAYYHVLETIALGDEPEVHGVCGIRPWRHKASDYCYKRKAASALARLISGLSARRVLLSYSSQAHVPLDELQEVLSGVGRVNRISLESIGRYRPNEVASKAGKSVTEIIFEVTEIAGRSVTAA